MKRIILVISLFAGAAALMFGAAHAGDKRIAITFDDAPMADSAYFTGAQRTPVLIAALKEARVSQAAFFVTTGNIEKNRGADRIHAYAAAGHVIASHSHAHEHLRDKSAEEYLADIELAETNLAGFANRRPWFRYPFLDEGQDYDKFTAVRDGLTARKIRNGYVTIDNYDWYLNRLAGDARTAGACVNQEGLRALYVETLVDSAEYYNVMAQTWYGRSPAHVLLLHENDLAALYLPDLAKALRRNGWKIISADEAYEDQIGALQPRTLFNGQGRVAAIAHALGGKARDLIHEREDEPVLDALFTSRVLDACEEKSG